MLFCCIEITMVIEAFLHRSPVVLQTDYISLLSVLQLGHCILLTPKHSQVVHCNLLTPKCSQLVHCILLR